MLVLGVLALAAVGYLGYVIYPRFHLPAGAGAGLLVLAAGAAVASFFSPCSFPLLVTIIARPLAEEAQRSGRRPLRAAIRFATALSAGAAAFTLLLGLGIAAGGGALFSNVTFTSNASRVIRPVVGVILIVFGLIQLGVVAISLRHLEPRLHSFLGRQAELRRRRPAAGFALFGFGYLLAGFG